MQLPVVQLPVAPTPDSQQLRCYSDGRLAVGGGHFGGVPEWSMRVLRLTRAPLREFPGM